MAQAPLPARMRAAAGTFLAALGDDQAQRARRAFADDAARRWIEYRPRPRPGVSLADLDGTARKAAHKLLATALSRHAYAQAMTIVALEEVLDREEEWRRGRHSGDFWVVVFGDPADAQWGWRFEGHHLSVTLTLHGDEVSPTPVFLGANPATLSHAGRPVTRPLAGEEDVARELLDAMGPRGRAEAIVADTAPEDILSAQRPRVGGELAPLGVPADRLNPTARALLGQLHALYVSRLSDELAQAEAARIEPDRLSFAWAGPVQPGHGHYYRVQGPDLLIEYDNTQNDANHAHTVLRRPTGDFGGDILAEHLTPGGHQD